MTPDQGNAYLDAIIQYRSLSANRTTSVSQDTLLAFYRTLAKHPKIEFDIDNKGPVSISDYTALLDSMTLEDAKGLRDGTVSHLSISIDAVSYTHLSAAHRPAGLRKPPRHDIKTVHTFPNGNWKWLHNHGYCTPFQIVLQEGTGVFPVFRRSPPPPRCNRPTGRRHFGQRCSL